MKVILRLHRFDEKTTGIVARGMLELNFSVRRNEVNGVSLTVRVVRFLRRRGQFPLSCHCKSTIWRGGVGGYNPALRILVTLNRHLPCRYRT